MRILLTVTCFLIFGLQIAAQGPFNKYNPKTFEIIKFKGKIDKFPITMLLNIYPDNIISGYYFYDNIGQFIKIERSKGKSSFDLIANFDEFDLEHSPDEYELFKFSDSLDIQKSVVKARWKYSNKNLSVILIRDSTMLNWKLLRIKSIGYFKDSYFNTQTKDFSFIYPTVFSSPVLNEYFLKNSTTNKEMISFINSTKSNYILIDQNFGENITELEDCCWSEFLSTELAYISDSILTYKVNGFTYANNGFGAEAFVSLKISNGKEYTIDNIFKTNSIDTVLAILTDKYKEVIHENSNENNILSFSKNSNVFIAARGVYFRERLFKLAPYVDLFMSFKELEPYLNNELKKTINCP
jgi:hypothetical protein